MRWASCWSSVWKDVARHSGWSVQCIQMLWLIIYHILELHTWTKCLISKFCYTSSLIYEYIIKVLYRNLYGRTHMGLPWKTMLGNICWLVVDYSIDYINNKVCLLHKGGIGIWNSLELQKFEWKASSNSLDTYVGPIPARLQ